MGPYYEEAGITIYCGDARDILPQIEADVLVTDPPYGVTLRSGWSGAFGECEIAGDESTDVRDTVLSLCGDMPAIVFGSWRAPRPANVKHILIWDKGEHVGMGDLSFPWKPNWEEIYVIGEGFAGRRTGSVLRHLSLAGTVAMPGPRIGEGRLHPTAKPVALMRDLIQKCPEGVVLDPFMGSGTTLRAAKDLGRKAIGIEIEERYCEIAA
ncbi:MAG: site-specific DNA-methyltransferase, partial [Thermomicrobiales bacterium]|nr:site-specific DNA-methyltransferase [Thermomicrobiales bacterium]